MGAKVKALGDSLELVIDGIIGDMWAEDPVTAEGVRKALATMPDAKAITVHVNSPGGDFFDGLQIYQLLDSHPARVTVRIGALAASSASLIAMAGDEIIAHETSQFLVHDPWTIAAGNEADFRKLADDLHTLSGSLVLAYQARTGMGEKELRSLMAEDRYMSAAEALKLGFLTSVTQAKAKESVTPEQARAQLTSLRAHARQRLAAMAAVQDSTQAPGAEENDTVKNEAIIAALGLTEGAQDADIQSAIAALRASSDGAQKVLAAAGAKTVDEAVGILAALKGADERAQAAETALADLRAKAEQADRDGIVATLRAEGKVTPAQEKDLLPALSLEALKAFARTAPKITALTKDNLSEPGAGAPVTKAFKDMSAAEQRELALSDPELYDQLSRQSA